MCMGMRGTVEEGEEKAVSAALLDLPTSPLPTTSHHNTHTHTHGGLQSAGVCACGGGVGKGLPLALRVPPRHPSCAHYGDTAYAPPYGWHG